MKRKIEVFTAGCAVCTPIVELVQSMSCGSCEIKIYDLSRQEDSEFFTEKLKQYNVMSVPTVVVNGKKLILTDGGITREQLSQAGLGQLN
ncbi:thioredoxin family protein [Daejeonella sp.]|uniref:thioredoxin family protein n=1 Tax=Daejeonella sp. TaxID=2805397 RepID=UPI0039833804